MAYNPERGLEMKCGLFQSSRVFGLQLLRDLAVCCRGHCAGGDRGPGTLAGELGSLTWTCCTRAAGWAGLPSSWSGWAGTLPALPWLSLPASECAIQQRPLWSLPQEQPGHCVFESFPSKGHSAACPMMGPTSWQLLDHCSQRPTMTSELSLPPWRYS